MYMTTDNGASPLPRRGRGGVVLPVAAALGLLLVAGQALAAGKLVLNLKTEKETVVKDEKGKESLKRVDLTEVNAIPGDEVILTLAYENVGKEKADNVAIDYPIPDKMLYKASSAEGRGTVITFSVDGGKTFGHPDKLTVLDEKGKAVPAKPKDYTSIRWSFSGPIAAGGKGTVGFRTFVR